MTRNYYDIAYIPVSYIKNQLKEYLACMRFVEQYEQMEYGIACMQNHCFERDILHAMSLN